MDNGPGRHTQTSESDNTWAGYPLVILESIPLEQVGAANVTDRPLCLGRLPWPGRAPVAVTRSK